MASTHNCGSLGLKSDTGLKEIEIPRTQVWTCTVHRYSQSGHWRDLLTTFSHAGNNPKNISNKLQYGNGEVLHLMTFINMRAGELQTG